MSAPCVEKVGRTTSGYRLRVEGTGTMRESPAVGEFAGHALRDGTSTLVVDLSACDYLDSTFLGCLVNLQKRHGRGQPPRLLIAASPSVGRRLFAANHLEPLFRFVDECPGVVDEDETIPPLAPGSRDMGTHILECHRCLAEEGGPNQAAFRQAADALGRELGESRPGPE